MDPLAIADAIGELADHLAAHVKDDTPLSVFYSDLTDELLHIEQQLKGKA